MTSFDGEAPSGDTVDTVDVDETTSQADTDAETLNTESMDSDTLDTGAVGADEDADHAWLGPTKQLLRDAVGAEVPTLGICLGHVGFGLTDVRPCRHDFGLGRFHRGLGGGHRVQLQGDSGAALGPHPGPLAGGDARDVAEVEGRGGHRSRLAA